MRHPTMMLAMAAAALSGGTLPRYSQSGGFPSMGNPKKQQGGRTFLMGERERQRRKWRRRVDDAAEEYREACAAVKAAFMAPPVVDGTPYLDALERQRSRQAHLRYVLSIPKPWRKERAK